MSKLPDEIECRLTQVGLEQLREEYDIPADVTMRLLVSAKHPTEPPSRMIIIYTEQVKAGLLFPLNTYRTLIGY